MIRQIENNDRAQLVKIISGIDIFKPEEKQVAIELIDETLEINKSDEYDYNIFVYDEGGKVLGYHCTGKRYMTEGTYDLYWIVVDQDEHGKGIGRKLIQQAEDFVISRKGNLLLAETSSTEKYYSTRKFYTNCNYEVLAEIKDFYKIGDNLVIFGKYLIT